MSTAVKVMEAGRSPLYVIVEQHLDLGRDCDGLLLVDERVSRHHLQIENTGGHLVVTDMQSSNGSFLDGQRIEKPVVLRPGAVVTIGSTTITLHVIASPGVGWSDGTVVGEDTPDQVDPTLRHTGIENVALAASHLEHAGLPVETGDDDVVTIMFSDIESSTELATSVGDASWMAILDDYRQIFDARVHAHSGTIVENQGDGYMVTFAGARRAMLCCARVQADLAEHAEANPERAFRARMGCHTGEAVRDNRELFGRLVTIAAQVANLAAGGEVLVSSVVKEITSARGDLTFGAPRSVERAGIDGHHEVYPLDWRALSK